MTRVRKSKQKAAAEWLELWNAAGRPVMTFEGSALMSLGEQPFIGVGSPGLMIEHSGAWRDGIYGRKSLLRISMAGHTVTEKVCRLIGLRSSKGGLVTINSGSGPLEDMRKLGRTLIRFHIKAAVACRDLSALAHFTGPEVLAAVRQIEEASLREVAKVSAAGARKQARPLRV